MTLIGIAAPKPADALSLSRGRFSDLPPNMMEPTNAARKKILHNGCSVATIARFK